MTAVMSWIINISIIVIVLAFVCLVIFACIFLFSIAKSIKRVSKDVTNISDGITKVVNHADDIVETFVPYCHIVGSFGKKMEKKIESCSCASCRKDICSNEENHEEAKGVSRIIMDAADWIHMGASLWEKIKSRRS